MYTDARSSRRFCTVNEIEPRSHMGSGQLSGQLAVGTWLFGTRVKQLGTYDDEHGDGRRNEADEDQPSA